jgi:hypothetical protein
MLSILIDKFLIDVNSRVFPLLHLFIYLLSFNFNILWMDIGIRKPISFLIEVPKFMMIVLYLVYFSVLTNYINILVYYSNLVYTWE